MCARKFRGSGIAMVGAVGLFLCSELPAFGQLKVVTTTPTYASLAGELGGEHVQVQSLMRGAENIHNIVATPSKMLALRDADLFIHSGLDLELWVPQLLRGSRNRRIQPGQPGNVNAARGIRLKEVPREISRSQGDIHIYGNPHYQLDPINTILMARSIRDALKLASPEQAAEFDGRYQAFEDRMKQKIVKWLARMRPYRGTKVAGYHNVLTYFADRFGLEVVGYVEEKPGISPSPSYLARIIARMRETDAKVLLVNTWANRDTADSVARATGVESVIFPEWVGGVSGTSDVISTFEFRIDSIVAALERAATSRAASPM